MVDDQSRNGDGGRGREQRSEARYPCVGIALLYSPSFNKCVSDFASVLGKAALHDMSVSGLSFDVTRSLSVGEKISLVVNQPDGGVEQLTTEVRWCRSLEDGRFRVGVKILESVLIEHRAVEGSELDRAGPISIAADQSQLPSEIDMICPACNRDASFEFCDIQPVDSDEGVMPLYNCSQCGTTRSLTGLFYFRRPR